MSIVGLFRNSTDAKSFAAGEVVFREGDPGDVMYVVLEGEVNVLVGDTVLDHHGVGGIVGEMALIENSPRSATVLALTDCRLAPVDQKRFTFMVQQTPYFSVQVMRIMAGRLRRLMTLMGPEAVAASQDYALDLETE